MNSAKIGKNYFYNLIYQALLIIIPIISMPYVSRVLGETESGKYSFTFSIVTYFTVFASLGFSIYAQRLVAGHQGDRKRQSVDFWEVFFARLLPVTVCLLIYFSLIFAGVYGEKYSKLMVILSIDVIAVAFDISFFYQGNEEFGKIVVRNALVKLCSLVLIFTLVKTENDLWIYTVIQSGALLFTNLFLWTGLKGALVGVDFKSLRPLAHLKYTVVLLLPTIATSVYVYLDKVLIGLITGSDAENGNYEYAEKIVKTLMTVITALGTVMIPHNSKKIAAGDEEGVKKNIYLACKFVSVLGIPIMLGMIAVANAFVPLYLGDGYPKAPLLLQILTPLVVIIGFSNVFGLQYLIPKHRDKQFTIAIIAGAVSNLILNLIFIPFYGAYGAAAASVIAESAVTVIMMVYVRKDIKLFPILKGIVKPLIAGIIMFVPVFILSTYVFTPTVLHTLIAVFIGIVIYTVCMAILRDEFLTFIFAKVKSKLKKGKE